MNKPLGVLVGIVVIAGVLNTAGAWYTGTKIEGELKTSIAEANKEMAAQLAGSATHGSIELVSIETHLYSSTAHYRLTLQDDAEGSDPQPVELLFVDHIEHGPLPWSRIKTFKWAPVMAVSNYALEKTPSPKMVRSHQGPGASYRPSHLGLRSFGGRATGVAALRPYAGR